ncbi:hypothetical protein [Haloarcula regularis]|uniref:hypothetical protein n=1 Tax=Haloarcula regularis TaxID=3033392 RepID=UPI0023E78AF2|nr:hypothetical protein [Halomicroarcula sp. SYNS111]
MASLRAALVCLLVLSAGCTTLASGPNQPDTTTEATPTTPPGVAEDAVDAAALVAAHERSLAGASVHLETVRSNRTAETNGTVRTRVWVDDNGTSRTIEVRERGAERRRVETWRGPAAGYRRGDDQRVTAVRSDVAPATRYRTARLERWLSAGRYTVRTVEDGTPRRYVLVADDGGPPSGERLEADEVRYEGRAVVTAGGRIELFAVTFVTVERNKWGRHVRARTYTYRVVAAGGVTVDRPDWVRSRAQSVGRGQTVGAGTADTPGGVSDA